MENCTKQSLRMAPKKWGGCMNKNVIHGAPKKGREWRIALRNHYAWLQRAKDLQRPLLRKGNRELNENRLIREDRRSSKSWAFSYFLCPNFVCSFFFRLFIVQLILEIIELICFVLQRQILV